MTNSNTSEQTVTFATEVSKEPSIPSSVASAQTKTTTPAASSRGHPTDVNLAKKNLFSAGDHERTVPDNQIISFRQNEAKLCSKLFL